MERGRLPSLRDVLVRDGRVRPVWRIIFYFVCFVLLAGAGSMAISSLPRTPLQWGGQMVVAAAAVISGWIALMRLDNRPPRSLGLPFRYEAVGDTLRGLGVGAALIVIAAVFLFASRSAVFATDEGTATGLAFFLAWTLLYFGIAALFEEAVFRGYPYQVLVEWLGVVPATFLMSGMFAIVHSQNPGVSTLAIINIFLAGVLLSIAYLRTMSLWFATGVHVGWNWMMAGVLDFPVSGLEFDTPVYSGMPVGSTLWTGGEFGPEAGLVGTVVLLIGVIWMTKNRRVHPDGAVLAARPLAEAQARESGLL